MLRKTSVLIVALAFQAMLLPAQAAQPASSALLAPLTGEQALDLPPLDPAVPRPDAVLGYPLGARFTHWDRIVDYLEAVDAASARVKMWEYGRTYEGRPLQLLAISTPENLARLDEIRQERLRLADPAGLSSEERQRLLGRLPAVVWLAYGVHGNESSSAEAAMGAVYVLAAGQGDIAEGLRNLIVLVDPLSNPDGRERYVHGFEQRRGDAPNTRRSAAEHWESWPGGRQNHYVIDLNRDWAWASQQETQQRITAYRSWEPQVYVDFHEMGADSSYFFPPAAEPIHPRIDRRVVSWLDVFGRGNAEAFDRQGWVYFKGENFDLFYPGYGDSYPSFRGAVGMTYEVAGGGRGGIAIALPDGSLLTLADRVARHLTTSLSTVRTAARNSRRLLEDFVAYRTPSGPGRTYLWSGEQQEARALAELLTFHGVRVQQLAQAAEIPVRSLAGDRAKASQETATPHRFAAGTYAVSTAQPLGNLVEVLMEIDAPMAPSFLDRQRQRFEQNLDAEFYDITAWSLPLAFNLEAWVTSAAPRDLRSAAAERTAGLRGDGSLGYLVPPQGIASYRLAAELQRRGLRYRVAMAELSNGDTRYPAGTLFIPRGGNPPDLQATLSTLAAEAGVSGQGIASSYGVSGLSLGSNDMAAVRPAHIGLLSGQGVDATSFGFLWHLLDQEARMPHDRLDIAQLRQVDLSDFDVLVLPSGSYEDTIGARSRETLDAWVRSGGVLVAVGDAVGWLQDNKMTTIKKWEAPKTEDDDPESEQTPEEKALASRPIYTPGAAVATRMPGRHPLTLGMTSPPAVLVEGTTVLLPTGDPRQDVLIAVDHNPVVAGYSWPEAEERLSGSLLVGTEKRGQGSVVLFAQDPAFRLFWRGTAPILLNALAYGPSTGIGAAH